MLSGVSVKEIRKRFERRVSQVKAKDGMKVGDNKKKVSFAPPEKEKEVHVAVEENEDNNNYGNDTPPAVLGKSNESHNQSGDKSEDVLLKQEDDEQANGEQQPPYVSQVPLLTGDAPIVFDEILPGIRQIDKSTSICVVSLNILSQHNLDNSLKNRALDERYTHVEETESDWVCRFEKMKRLFQSLLGEGKTDVLAMQEVDYAIFAQDLVPFFSPLGFTGVHQWGDAVAAAGDEKPPHPWGVATFYNSNKLAVNFKESRSRSLILGLNFLQDEKSKVFILNMHLEANSEKTTERLKQLHSTLYRLSLNAAINPKTARIIVLGDFNSTIDEAPMRWLTDVANFKSSAEIPTHAFRFHSSYDDNRFTQDQLKQVHRPTYQDKFIGERVDQLAYTSDTLKVLGVLGIPPTVGEKVPIYSKTYPSDHYPVGGVFDLIEVSYNEEEEEKKENAGLTIGQMRVLEFLERGAPLPRSKRKGKPSDAEMAAIKSHQESVDAFSTHLTAKQKAFVKKWRQDFRKNLAKEQKEGKTLLLQEQNVPPMLGAQKKRSMSLKITKKEEAEELSMMMLGTLFEDKTVGLPSPPPPLAQESSNNDQPMLDDSKKGIKKRSASLFVKISEKLF